MNNDLIKYIEKYILPLYENYDRSHRLWHITGVIERSLYIAHEYDVDLNMIYTIAAFHDIGTNVCRSNHEIESANIFIKNKKMKTFFSKKQLTIIKEAIEDHRASLEYEPRSIYGKIIATADKFIDVDDVLKSVHLHTIENFPNVMWEEASNKSYQYLNKKYGENDYAKIPLPFPLYDKFLLDVRKLLNDQDAFNTKLKLVDDNLKKEFKELA